MTIGTDSIHTITVAVQSKANAVAPHNSQALDLCANMNGIHVHVKRTTAPKQLYMYAGSAFGPDYAHHKDSAFGIYACGFDFNCQRDILFQQVQPGNPFLIINISLCPSVLTAALNFCKRQRTGSLCLVRCSALRLEILLSEHTASCASLGSFQLTRQMHYRT